MFHQEQIFFPRAIMPSKSTWMLQEHIVAPKSTNYLKLEQIFFPRALMSSKSTWMLQEHIVAPKSTNYLMLEHIFFPRALMSSKSTWVLQEHSAPLGALMYTPSAPVRALFLLLEHYVLLEYNCCSWGTIVALGVMCSSKSPLSSWSTYVYSKRPG